MLQIQEPTWKIIGVVVTSGLGAELLDLHPHPFTHHHKNLGNLLNFIKILASSAVE